MFANKQKYKLLKTLVYVLEFLTIGLVIYLLILPYYTGLKYKIISKQYDSSVFKNEEQVKKQVAEIKKENKKENKNKQEKQLRQKEQVDNRFISNNRLIITKIGLNAPIIEFDNETALNYGSWRWPESSTPEQGGNTVITGHRFKYLPPNNLTFYLFDKLDLDDIITVIWQEKEYYYKIHRIKIVDKHEVSILEPSDKPILTLFTCHPIFSDKQRLVIIADLIVNE